MIGAHPDDEDTNLIAWLQRGRGVETAYLSLTRGDGGQNLIGNELGEALGVIRTEELLAARRIDGAQQYFTRAFDFGFSKDTIDTFNHWQRDSILGDVVRVVRAFRPHVIVAVFSGTPRDGHGHHQVSGLLARAAYDVSADTVRFPTARHGPSWTVAKFYRAARGNQQGGTLAMDVGEYSPLIGRSYGEIAGESRSQHKSQGFGAPQRKGPIMNYVRREASRVNEATAANTERSMFDGIDTTWARFRPLLTLPALRAAADSMARARAEVQAAFDAYAPEKLFRPLRTVGELIWRLRCSRESLSGACTTRSDLEWDLFVSAERARARWQAAVQVTSGISIDAIASSDVVAVRGSIPVVVTIHNRGRDTAMVTPSQPGYDDVVRSATRVLPPGGVLVDTVAVLALNSSEPNWLRSARVGAMFEGAVDLHDHYAFPPIVVVAELRSGGGFSAEAPVVFRRIDQVRGEVLREVNAVPAVAITLDGAEQFVPANINIDRDLLVRVRFTGDTTPRDVRVSLALPRGLVADSATRSTRLSGRDAWRTLTFRVRGRLPAGVHRIDALAESNGETFRTGYEVIDYEHIRAQRVYRPASTRLSAVNVRVPAALRVAYVTGVSDNIAPTLTQLGIPVTTLLAREVAAADLSRYSTVVVGPRAYDATPELAAANAKLFDFARGGGTVVVQYGQYEMTQPGMTPFPLTINRPHDRVTLENAPVTILDPNARELMWPNKITDADFAGWVQERSLYMPRTFDANYRPLFAMNDPNEAANRGAVLVAPLGKGKYIYTSLALFRQLPAGVPGAARLFVNLLSANLTPTSLTP
jgi:LmbE family N-acetylglucosaminyl deacetylase